MNEYSAETERSEAVRRRDRAAVIGVIRDGSSADIRPIPGRLPGAGDLPETPGQHKIPWRRRGDNLDVDDVTITSEDGHVVHVAPGAVIGALRYTVDRLRLRGGDLLPTSLGVVATHKGEGASFICRSLAAVLASDPRTSVCLVNVNWWTSDLPATGRPGMAELLGNGAPPSDAVVPTTNPRLHYVAAGAAEGWPIPELVRSARLPAILAELRDRFRHVLLELPPLLWKSDAMVLADHADGRLLVVRQDVTTLADVQAAVDSLGERGALGIVLNRASTRIPQALHRLVSNY